MAYVSKELKANKAPKIKKICQKYGVKGTLAVRRHSTLVLNIKSGKIDFIKNCNDIASKKPRPDHLPFVPATNHLDVNVYWYHEHFSGTAKKFLQEIMEVMNEGNHDRSDIQTDYFDVGWYVNINIGNWDKPYSLISK